MLPRPKVLNLLGFIANTSLSAPAISETGLSNCFDSVILLAIDGVRSEDVFGEMGQTPRSAAASNITLSHLHAIENTGIALGARDAQPFFASGPNFVSLPGYMEMLSGTSKTDCTENDCTIMRKQTLLDDFQLRYPDEASGVIGSWPNLRRAASRNGMQHGFVSAGKFSSWGQDSLGPRSKQALVQARSEANGHESYRGDEHTARLALSYLHEHQPRFLFVSLGDTDERAHQGDGDGYWRALQFADDFVGALREVHHELQSQNKRTLLLVTTDHGRSNSFAEHGRDFPESGRSFLLAEGSEIGPLGRVKGTKPRYLRDIAPSLRAACDLPESHLEHGRIISELVPERRAPGHTVARNEEPTLVTSL